jgi:hypothetical protein
MHKLSSVAEPEPKEAILVEPQEPQRDAASASNLMFNIVGLSKMGQTFPIQFYIIRNQKKSEKILPWLLC